MSKKIYDISDYSINIKSGRMVRRNTTNGKKLARQGLLKPIEHKSEPEQLPTIPEPIPEPTIPEPEPITMEIVNNELQPELRKNLENITKNNKKQFKNLDQKQSDELLKRMLYDKLVINKPKAETKPKKKKKYKIKYLTSDESESESD